MVIPLPQLMGVNRNTPPRHHDCGRARLTRRWDRQQEHGLMQDLRPGHVHTKVAEPAELSTAQALD
jgi:hypothetical protein